MATESGVRISGSIRGAEPGWAYIKDRCDGCNRVVFAYVPLDTPLDPPMCEKCQRSASSNPGRVGAARKGSVGRSAGVGFPQAHTSREAGR